MAWERIMSTHITMQTHAANYLSERRRLGFALRSPGYSVTSFARYVDALNLQEPLTVEIMADWARRDAGNSDKPARWARRIGQRLAPHIYSELEIIDLLAAARCLGPSPGLRGVTYETLFGLIASTGLRVSEAVHLLDTDVDLKFGMLTIRQTKFAKSRQVPMHPSTIEALRLYRSQRNSYIEVSDETPFFVGTRGRLLGHELSLRQVHRVFIGLRDHLGWLNRGAHSGPRIHDLRHTFVVRRVMLWHAQGVDVDPQMLALSTYVGHAMVTNTYWYLTGIPELMALAAAKFEAFTQVSEVCHV
jgi:integrase